MVCLYIYLCFEYRYLLSRMANALCLSPATEDSTAGSIPTLPSPTTSGGVVALKTGGQEVTDLIPSRLAVRCFPWFFPKLA